MTGLEALNLAHNPLHEVPQGLWSLSALSKLSVEGCNIRFPPEDVVAKGVKSLLNFQRMIERGRYTRRLDLSGIGFHQLTVPVDMWAPLVVLNIDRNYVSTLPGNLQECSALTELRTANNQLVRLPEALGELASITLLDVRNNLLQSLPESFILLQNCQRLRVSGNRLVALPEPLNGLTALGQLEADDNALNQVPQSLCDIGGLKQLRLSRNRITQLPLGIGKMTALELLTLTSNALLRLPLNLRLLTSLIEFDARDNPDIDLPPYAVVEQGAGATRNFLSMVHATLRTNQLDMSGFKLVRTPKFLAGMTGLTGLNLANNYIDELYTVVPLMKTLTTLNALGNKIKYLPIEIGGRTSLKSLQLDQDIWDMCATELRLSASRHVRDYLRRILEGRESNALMLNGMGLQNLPVLYATENLWHSLTHIEHLNLESNMLRAIEVVAELTLLKTLELTGNQLQTLPESFAKLTALTKVSLAKNNLHAIPLCIQKWVLLKDLSVADNEIVGLPVPVLEALKELTTLDCKNNKIHEIKGPIWMLPRLHIIDVHGNDVVSPPTAFVDKGKRAVMGYFKSLDNAARTKMLNLKQSNLRSLPSEVISIRGLTSLVLDENEMDTLSEHIDHLKDLATLSVKHNRLTSLPEAVSALVNLKELDVSANQLAELPIASMLCMSKLASLNLEGNSLVTAPFELFQSTTLKKIRLAGNHQMVSPPSHILNDESMMEAVVNFLRLEARAITSSKLILTQHQITDFPIEITRVPVITELTLSKNRLSSVADEIGLLTSMQKLNLDQNLLDALPEALGLCVNLMELHLVRNELTTLPMGLSALHRLHLLDMSKNQLQTLPDVLQHCTRLLSLVLNENSITEIAPWISVLSNLRTLQLASNEITSLPFQFAGLKKLHDLGIEDNDVGFPPPAILEAGLDSVRNYLHRLQDSPKSRAVDLSGVTMASFSCHPYMASFLLTQVTLRHCGLRHLKPDISRLSALQDLDVSHNQLAWFPPCIGDLKALRHLNAENNAITVLEPSLGSCLRLRTLAIANNQLTSLPPSLGFATNLKSLVVTGNPVVSPPEVYLRKRPLPWLLQYLRARHEGDRNGNLQLCSMSLSDMPTDVMELGALLKLNLNCNDLRDMPKDFRRLTSLQHFSITNNKLMRVPETICEMTWLQALLLDDNMISELPLSINSLQGLRSLSVAHNSLSSLPVKLNGLSKLRCLTLDGNTIAEVPRAIMQLTEMRILSMRQCGVAVLPEGITHLVALQELHMNDNALESLPDLSACRDMRIMRLSNNRLHNLSPSVVELMELRELSLIGNMMQRLPDDFTRLTNLQLLHLDGRNFDSIPPDINEQGGRRMLEYMRKMALADTTATLDLSGMSLRNVPSALFTVSALQNLFLHNNPIAKIPPMLCQLTNLRALTLNETRVRALPIDLPQLYQLKKLDLDLDRMVFPPSEVCSLGLNAIFTYLRKILNGAIKGSLDLSNTGMKEIPPDLSHFTGIKTLDLSNNRIPRVPPELCLLTSLTSLNLDMNPLRPHVQDVVSRGLHALLKYLRCLLSGAQTGKLDVVQQSLAFYPDEVMPDWHLTWLRLDENLIRHIPRKLGHLTSLTYFSVVNNQLQDLPETMLSLTALKTLLVDHNEMKQLPSFVYEMTSVCELSLTFNQLSVLSDDMKQMDLLQDLRVQGNAELKHLPMVLGEMRNLKQLEFDKDTVVSPDPQFQTDHATITGYLATLSESRRTGNLDLSNRGLSALPIDVLLLTGLSYLTVARNKITKLPDDMCRHLSNLRMLDLEANKIEALPLSIGFARGLTCICALGNQISRIPNSLGLVHDHGILLELDPDRVTTPPAEIFSRGTSQALTYLRLLQDSINSRTLSLNKWRLSAMPIEVTDLEGLTELSLSHNKMTFLPSEIANLSQLTRLKASDNLLASLPPELGALSRLTDLDVTGNPLDSGFPGQEVVERGLEAIQALMREVLIAKRLEILEIGHLSLNSLHLGASTLTKLRRLSLDRVAPVHLEDFVFSATPEQLGVLTELSITEAALDFLPHFVPSCTLIQALNLSNNRLRVLPEEICLHMTNLTELRLSNNKIREICDKVSLLTDLKVLALSGNQLSEVNEVIAECCTQLQELYVAHNTIQSLPQNLSRCEETMRVLDLEHNQMDRLPTVALALTQLTCLKLASNPITSLPLQLGKLLYLTEITVPTSDLGNVPRDVVQAGGKAIIRYVCGISECAGSGLLDLSKMNLQVLPPSIRDLKTSLTYLKLDDNHLKRLPNWLGEMQQLVRLSVQNTPVQRLPATLGAIATLEEVAVDSDSTALVSPPVQVVASGKAAILSYLRRSYAAVVHRHLDLSGFGLKQFPLMALSTPTTLTCLSLNDNELDKVPDELCTIKGLVLLSLTNNRISHLPPKTFPSMPLLRTLNVGGNPLERLPLTLGGLSSLEFLEFDASDVLQSPPRDITVKSVVAVVRYLKRAWQGRVTGKLDLSALDLTDIPLEVTGWAPQVQITPSQLPDLAPEEGAEEVQAVEKRGGRAGARGGSTGEEGAGGNGVSERGGGQDGVGLVGVTVTPGGAVSVFGGLPTPQEQHSGGEGQEEGASVEARDDKGAEEDGGGDAAVREAAYAVDDAAGREEQKKQVVEAMAAADMLQGEDADMDAQGYDNRHDEDVRDFEVEEDIPATQVLEYTRRRDQADQEDGLNQKDAEEVESLVSSDDDESLGVLLDEEEEEEMRLPAEEGIEGYKALVSLDVRDNSITSLRTEVGLMQSLSCIYMCRNEIKVLPDALAQLCNLKTLVATHNQIQALPPDFGSLKCSLRLLDLSNNLLSELPGALFDLTLLEELNLNHNKLAIVNIEQDDALPNLKYCYLNSNQIIGVNVLGEKGLASLRVFTAISNELASCPDLRRSRRLRELQLADNCLNMISPWIKELRLLRMLDVSNNQLSDVPAELSEVVRLQELLLYGNPLDLAPTCALDADTGPLMRFLSALNAAAKTGIAKFSDQELGAIPLQLLRVTHIHHVDLSCNGLSGMPRQISMLTQLKVLDLRDNLFDNVPIELSFCPLLHTLTLDRNRFADVVPNICAISQLEVLSLNENLIVALPPDMANMVSLVMLDLRGNEHLSLVAGQLLRENLSRLMLYLRTIQTGLVYENINLSRRGLTNFPIEVHSGNGTLKVMCLAYNELVSLPETLEELCCLTTLDVSNNILETLPQSLGSMTKLTELLLNDNQLSSLPGSFVNLSGLTALALERNPLENFPFEHVENWTLLNRLTIDSEKQMVMPEGNVHTTTALMPLEVVSQGMSKCLEYRQRMQQARVCGAMDLSVMQLSLLPNSVLRMPLLTKLNLTGNALLTIPEGITALISMQDLGLNDNRLRCLPPQMGVMSSLRILSVMDNRLEYLAPQIGRLTSMIDLNLTNNPDLLCPPPEVFKLGVKAILSFLDKISHGIRSGSIELAGLNLVHLLLPWDDLEPKLQAMVLSRNRLESVPTRVDRCTALTALWVDSNQLTTLPPSFGQLHALKSLALDMNQLSALPACVCQLTALQRLTLDNNVLRFLHPRMSELQSLTLLSAANNRLTMLPASIASISCLRTLTLSGNELAPLPPALRDRRDIDIDVSK